MTPILIRDRDIPSPSSSVLASLLYLHLGSDGISAAAVVDLFGGDKQILKVDNN